jgi:hypothetical protein
VRKKYTGIPIDKPDPGLKGQQVLWIPSLDVRFLVHHQLTPPVKAVVDSGSPYCLFRAQIGEWIGIDVQRGEEGQLGGIIANVREPIYFHRVQLLIENSWRLEVLAGFMKNVGVAAILGRSGFFDCFRVTFDHSTHPPELEITRITTEKS